MNPRKLSARSRRRKTPHAGRGASRPPTSGRAVRRSQWRPPTSGRAAADLWSGGPTLSLAAADLWSGGPTLSLAAADLWSGGPTAHDQRIDVRFGRLVGEVRGEF